MTLLSRIVDLPEKWYMFRMLLGIRLTSISGGCLCYLLNIIFGWTPLGMRLKNDNSNDYLFVSNLEYIIRKSLNNGCIHIVGMVVTAHKNFYFL